MPAGDLLIELNGVSKDYRGLRPLRVQQLELRPGDSVALLGFDAAMAEVLVNLITAAQLPDIGEVRVCGRPTSAITGVDDWVSELDRFGLITDRAVLVDQLTTEQNLALPLSLEVEPLAPSLRDEVHQLAGEVGLAPRDLGARTGELMPAARLRLRLGRALALRPSVVLAEHPNATLTRSEAASFAADFARITSARGLASLILTADATFARSIADRVLQLEAASGVLKPLAGWRRWLS